MTPERIAELTALCEKAKEMAPTYTEILLQPSIKDQTCTRVEECAYYDLSATRQLHNEIAASVGSALPELLAELTRLTRERDEAFNAGIEAAEKAAQRYEPFGPPDDDFCNKRPDEGEIAQVMWSRTQLTVEAIRALKKPAGQETRDK